MRTINVLVVLVAFILTACAGTTPTPEEVAPKAVAAEPATATPTFVPSPTPPPTPMTDILASVPEAACIPRHSPPQAAQLVAVVDGDTIDVRIDGQQYRVRYIGMDTPERDEAFYREATGRNRQLVSGRTLYLFRDVSETDRYGRLLRYVVTSDRIFVNYALVREGYATTATFPPDVACADAFRQAEQLARAEGRGLWGQAPPAAQTTPPQVGGGGNCHPAYPDVCIPPPPPDLNCKDIPYRRFRVDHTYGDPHRFDGDKDGIGCESG